MTKTKTLKSTLLPDPWASMSIPDLLTCSPAQTREVLTSIHAPTLDAARHELRTTSTSVLVTMFTNRDVLERVLVPDEDLDKWTSDEINLLVTAALLAIGDEIDHRFPVQQ